MINLTKVTAYQEKRRTLIGAKADRIKARRRGSNDKSYESNRIFT